MKTKDIIKRWIETTPDSEIIQRYYGAYTGIKKERLEFALAFMKKHLRQENNKDIFSKLHGIDFSYPVKNVRLFPGTELFAYRDPRVSPFRGRYFTKPGHPKDRLGVHLKSNAETYPKEKHKTLVRYEVKTIIPEVLESRCASTSDHWSIKDKSYMVTGGALQYLIPDPGRYLIYTTPFPKK